MLEHTTNHQDTQAPELPGHPRHPGKVADFLRAAELEPAERAVLDHGVTVRRGQGGYTLRVRPVPSVHRALLGRCQPLDAASAIPAQRKARREYANRINAVAATTGP